MYMRVAELGQPLFKGKAASWVGEWVSRFEGEEWLKGQEGLILSPLVGVLLHMSVCLW